MKAIKSFIGLAFVLFASFFVVSCNDDVEETLEQQWASVLDNHGCNYDYSDDGKCFGDDGGISKENFDKVIVGHGWKHYGTWEIDKYGKRLPLEYYHNIIGVSPDNYYFDSNTKLTIYYRSNTAGSAIKKSEVAILSIVNTKERHAQSYCLAIKNTFKSLAGQGVSNLLSAWFTHWE